MGDFMKAIMILVFFCFVMASLKPTPSVEEITKVNKIYCRDICK